jgi:two-component system phosphate regulon sensor histidine kinase PhoR
LEALIENHGDPRFNETAEFLAVLDQETARLVRIVERMLESARLGGGTELRLQPVLLADLVRETVRGLAPLLDERGMQLELDVAVDLPVVQVDHDLLRQVLVNLIHNAIKFSAPGRRIWVQAQDRSGTQIEIQVRDEGFGIVREEIDRIFDPYFRSSDDRVGRQRGAGLGLAIVKTIVEQHGGRIVAESRPDHGTTFRFTIPQV